jgi:hypothetical protein
VRNVEGLGAGRVITHDEYVLTVGTANHVGKEMSGGEAKIRPVLYMITGVTKHRYSVIVGQQRHAVGIGRE